MSKIKLTGDSSGYVEISAGDNAGNNTLELPTSGTKVVASDSSNNVNGLGIVTATTFSGALSGNVTGNLTGDVTGNVTGSAINVTGVITATSFSGDGSSLTGIDATQIQTGNTSVQTVDTGSDGHVKVTTEGTERLRVTADGDVGIGTDNVTVGSHRALQVHSENTNSYLVLTNNTSGTDAANDGVSFVLTGSDVNILNRESGNILLSTNGGERASIRSTGDLRLNHGLTGLTGGGVLVCASSSNASTSANWPETVDFTIPMGNLSSDYDNAVRNYYSSGETGSTYQSSAGSACLLLASCWNTYYWGYATKLYLCTVYGQSSKTTALQQLHSYSAAGHPNSSASISLSVVSTTSGTPKLRASFDGDYWNSNTCEVVMLGGGFANPTCLGPSALTGFHSNLTGQDAAWT